MLAHVLLDQLFHQTADRTAHRRDQLQRFRTARVAGKLPFDGGDLPRYPAHARQQFIPIRDNVHRIPPYTIFRETPSPPFA